MTGEKNQPSDKLAYLDKELKDRCASFHGSVNWYRRRYYVATMSAVLLSALITLIAGWKPNLSIGVDGSNIVLILGAISTVISAWGAFFSPKESWGVYASTLNRLRALQAKIDFLTLEPKPLTATSDSIAELFQEYQSILDAHNKALFELRSEPNQALHADAPQAARR